MWTIVVASVLIGTFPGVIVYLKELPRQEDSPVQYWATVLGVLAWFGLLLYYITILGVRK